MKGFKDFLMRGNVIDLAIAVVVGTAFTALVSSAVANLFTPLIAAIFGQPDFANLTFKINKSTFLYGRFINSLITFLVVTAVIYFVVVLPLTRLRERRRGGKLGPKDDPTLSDEAKLLIDIRDVLVEQRR